MHGRELDINVQQTKSFPVHIARMTVIYVRCNFFYIFFLAIFAFFAATRIYVHGCKKIPVVNKAATNVLKKSNMRETKQKHLTEIAPLFVM